MRKYVLVLLAGLSLLLASNVAQADFGGSCNSCNTGGGSCAGKSGFWSRTNKVGYFCSEEEERWQKFWHDYYRALGAYYKRLDRLDWVIYYKMHGYVNGGGCQAPGGGCAPMGPGCAGCYYAKPQYAPVFVQPQMTWGVAGVGCQPAGCSTGGGGYGCAWPCK